MIKKITTILFTFVFFSIAINTSAAQVTSSGIAISVPIADETVINGDIICTYPDGNHKCRGEYDLSIFGVVTENASLELLDSELEGARPVINSGITSVRVKNSAGNIREGDFITTSSEAGVGQRAARSGFVLGVALENYDAGNPEEIGIIQVLINIHPEANISGTRGNLLQFIRQGIAVPVLEPVEALRYLLAIAMVLISFTFGLIYFGRASRAGIEAIGRNPLAKKVIQMTVVLNIVLTLVIVAVGLGIAYLILVL